VKVKPGFVGSGAPVIALGACQTLHKSPLAAAMRMAMPM
jgi:hypothetical protein